MKVNTGFLTISPFYAYQSMADVICRACACIMSLPCVCTRTTGTCHLLHAVPCDLASALHVSDSEELHLSVFQGLYNICDGVCIGSAFESIKLCSSPFAFFHDCNMSVTLCISLLSVT